MKLQQKATANNSPCNPEKVFFIFHPFDRQLDSRITPESNTQKVPATFQDTGYITGPSLVKPQNSQVLD